MLERLGLARKPMVTLSDFRERVIAEMLTRRPELRVDRVGDADIEYGEGGYSSLGRAYQYYRERPLGLEAIVAQIAERAVTEPEPAAPEELIVLVRPETFDPETKDELSRGLSKRLPGSLIAVVTVDKPRTYVFMTAAALRSQLGLDDDAIWARAMANLRDRLGSFRPTPRPGKMMGVKSDIGLAASILLLDEFWTYPDLASLGDLVVAPVERDELVIVPLSEPELLPALRNLVARRDGPAFLTDRLLLRRNGAWEEFE
ncbi:MAG: hypothetical protein JSR98_15715 [Proteobacteria bacterium]|nr:hypothetical protein [Pseudomonadota bacterium]